MALLLSDIQNYFKVLGKMVNLAYTAQADATSYQQAIMTAVRQAVSGQSSEYNAFSLAVLPLHTNVKALITTVSSLPASAQTSAELFLKNIVAPALDTPLAVTATIPQIVAGLATTMTRLSATLVPSGTANANSPSGFAVYFKNTWNVTGLPQAANTGAANVPDTYITTAVV